MQSAKGILVAALACVALTACASNIIKASKGAERVSLANADQIAACQPKGKTTVDVFAKVGFVKRDADEVEANMYKVARNDAVEMGADTIVKGESPEFGRRIFLLYKCRP